MVKSFRIIFQTKPNIFLQIPDLQDYSYDQEAKQLFYENHFTGRVYYQLYIADTHFIVLEITKDLSKALLNSRNQNKYIRAIAREVLQGNEIDFVEI